MWFKKQIKVKYVSQLGHSSGQFATQHKTFRSSGELQTAHKRVQVTHIFLQVVYFYSTTVSIPNYYFLIFRISKNCKYVPTYHFQLTFSNLPFQLTTPIDQSECSFYLCVWGCGHLRQSEGLLHLNLIKIKMDKLLRILIVLSMFALLMYLLLVLVFL